MKRISFLATKPIEYYKGIRIKADTGLHEQLADIILDVLPRGSRVLDFGAGEGALSQRLHDLGYRVYSVDIDQENFKAGTVFKRLDFNNLAETMSFQAKHANEFDLVLSVEVIGTVNS